MFIKGIADPRGKFYPSLNSQTFAFLKPFSGSQSILILNGCGTSIHFSYGKMSRKISRDNAIMYPDIKSPIGFRILLNQTDVCYHDTDTFNVNENVNNNKEWLSYHVCMQFLHGFAIEMCVCLVWPLILLLFVFLDHGLFAHFKDGVLCSFRIVFVINAHLYINILDFKLTGEQGSGII